MAYNTKPIATDKDGNPISQYYNPETDQYEPVEGQAGANKVILYSSDGTENTGISLLPILEKLEQLTGTVIDEETRKSNELQRQELYNQIKNMLETGQLKGDKGDTGAGLEFTWQGTKLGVRIEGQTEYIYVDLQGPQGLQGPPGTIENLTSEHVTTALGYTPASETNVGNLSLLTTADKTNLVNAINEVDSKSVDLTPVEEKIDNLAGAGRTTETVKGNADKVTQLTNYVGDLESLTTVEKSNIVGALNEINGDLKSHQADYTKYGFGNRPYTVSYNTIYVDEANGDDTNDGLSEQTAVKTPNRLIQLIPIFLQNADFTIKIIGNLSAVLGIPTVLSHSSGASRRLIVEGMTQNKENHELSSGIRAYAVQCILEIRHVNVTSNAVVCSACTYVEINNVSSSLDTDVTAPITANNGTNMYISNSEINNPSGACIMSVLLSLILSRDNTGSGTYGLYANSGDIIKSGTTQPTGTTSDEREATGGVVR